MLPPCTSPSETPSLPEPTPRLTRGTLATGSERRTTRTRGLPGLQVNVRRRWAPGTGHDRDCGPRTHGRDDHCHDDLTTTSTVATNHTDASDWAGPNARGGRAVWTTVRSRLAGRIHPAGWSRSEVGSGQSQEAAAATARS